MSSSRSHVPLSLVADPKETSDGELAHSSIRPPTPERLDHGLQALSRHITKAQARRTSLLRWSLAGVTMAAAAGLFAFLSLFRSRVPHSEPPALAYHIEGGSVLAGGYLRESGHGGIKLSFADGTELALLPGTRGRLRSLDSRNVRIAIEQGTASVPGCTTQ